MKLYRKRHSILLFLLIIFLSGIKPVLLRAEEVPVAYRGEVITFEDEKNVISIEKGEVTYKDIRISADFMRLDRDTNEVVAQGNVKLVNADGNVYADSMRFDLDTEKGTFNRAKSEFQDKEIKEVNGKIYIGGEYIEYTSDKTTVTNATISTCEFGDLDYRLDAKEAEYYPEDKIVMRRVTYRQGNTPLMYWPSLTISLKEKNDSLTPEFGYSNDDGYFAKFTYPYYLRPQSTGNIKIDYFSKKGFAGGLDHYELFPWGGYARLFYYLKSNKYALHPDRKMEFKFFAPNYALNGWSIDFTSDYLSQETAYSTVSTDYVLSNLVIKNDVSKYRTSVNINQWNYIKPTKKSRLTLDLNESFILGKNINTQLQLNYDSDLHGIDSSIGPDYRIMFNQYENLYRWGLTLAKKVYNYSSSNLYKLYTLPEFTLANSRAIFPKGFPIYTNFYYQRTYNEFNKESITHWYSYSTYDNPKIFKPYVNGELTYGGNYKYDFYSNTNRTHNLNTWIQLAHNYTNEIRLTNRFNHQQTWTITNKGEVLGSQPLDDLNSTLTANKQRWNLNVNSGYYFTTRRYKDLATSYSYRPNYKLSLNATGSYNLNEGKLSSLSGGLEYRPRDKWTYALSTSYSPTANQLSSVSARADVQLNEAWRIEYQKSYDLINGEATSGGLTVTRDIHCQELKFTYQELQKKATLEFRIKALPTYNLKLDATQDGLTLDPSIITNIMNTGNQ